jgi:hypothetical protein
MVAPSVPCTILTPIAPLSLSFRCGPIRTRRRTPLYRLATARHEHTIPAPAPAGR